MDDRKKHGWAFWLAVALIVLPVLYVASFGPACWLTERDPATLDRIAPRIYWPIGWLCWKSARAKKGFGWYATIRGPDYVLLVPAGSSGFPVVGMSRR